MINHSTIIRISIIKPTKTNSLKFCIKDTRQKLVGSVSRKLPVNFKN